MTRKKKSQSSEQAQTQTPPPPTPAQPSSTPTPPPNPWFGSKPKNGDAANSALIICRNKHWRYISSFHGPWLQLPPEVLESLAHSNYIAPRPHPIDPAAFYDLVKIRKAVDEATNIAVRAASGVTSASLNASMSANNGMLNSAGAAALGIGFGGSGGTAKLSRERKHRMRELATQKLSQAYHLDEIAASVATMQSASTLEDLALHVLQRNQLDYDARYVHFFHEKIPSRMMAECTTLDPLNSLLAERPSDGSAFRTRALTRIFKEDFVGAARDLSEGLAAARWLLSQHRAGKDQLVLASEAAKQRGNRDWRNEIQIPEEDQPSSLEVQMLFHRANVHLAIACQHVHDALDAHWDEQDAKQDAVQGNLAGVPANGQAVPAEDSTRGSAERLAHKRHLEYRRMVKSNARKALKDYLEFLKHFDYTPGIPTDLAEEFVRRINAATQTEPKTRTKNVNGAKITTSKMTLDFDLLANDDSILDPESGALVPSMKNSQAMGDLPSNLWPPPPEIFPASQLFSEKVPSTIPPYPNPSTALAARSGPTSAQMKSSEAAAAALADSNESVTYHPLLTDALHSLLLCHALLQTSPTELKRHAHNAARLARICDGYPLFLAARSPARADWVEVLRRASNWIGLAQSWEALCRPAPLPGHGTQGLGDRGWNLGREPDTPVAPPSEINKKTKEENEKTKRERRKHEAILEALADDRVVDEESFQRAVRAREKRAIEDEEAADGVVSGSPSPQPQLIEDDSPLDHNSIEETAGAPSPAMETNIPPVVNGTKTTASKKPTANGHTNGASANSNGHSHKRWAQEEGKDYPISTERAEAISRWVKEAPLTVEGAGKGKKGGKKKPAATKKAASSSVEASVASLNLADGDAPVEEEIDE